MTKKCINLFHINNKLKKLKLEIYVILLRNLSSYDINTMKLITLMRYRYGRI